MSETFDDVMLTTSDNPFDPFTQFEEWYAFDTQKGYNTCAYLGRICLTSPDLSDPDNQIAYEEAIDEIIKYDITGKYQKVRRNDQGEGG